MTKGTDELESKLEGGIETQTFDVKDSCAWNVDSIVKDILAMSNVQDGGYILIGVEDGTFARHGISAAHKATYDLDIMKDQMAPYADPHTNFALEFPRDHTGLEYAVIRVFPFEEQPVICRKNGKEVHAGVLYYRNRAGRVQSAAVSNAHDMREIITNATVKMMQSVREKGFSVAPQVREEELVQKIMAKERNGL